MIYLDNNATTFTDPDITSVYMDLLRHGLGNPNSMHAKGRYSRHIMQKGKQRIADFFDADPNQVIITSGATEAIYTILLSLSGHVISSVLEHTAVREALSSRGKETTILLPHPGRGSITLEQIIAAHRPDTEAIVLNAANHETGICNPIVEIAEWARGKNILIILDGVGWIGKKAWPSLPGKIAWILSGHKIHAPVGVGALILQGKISCRPLFLGGKQQKGMRGGTEMVALTECLALALEKLDQNDFMRMEQYRNQFEADLSASLSILVHGRDEERVASVSNLAVPHIDGESLLMQLDLHGIAASHGSACQTGALELSPVLLGMGLPRDEVSRSIRFSFSRWTTQNELQEVTARLLHFVASI